MKEALSKELAKATGLAEDLVLGMLSVPPGLEMGDLAFPCFRLGGNPNQAAIGLSKKITLPKGFSKVEVQGCYLNFFYDRAIFIQNLLSQLEKKGFGHGAHKKEKVMVEYSQPNTHKAFHIGHLRNAVLGSALVNIMRYAGYDVVASNYMGDIGNHVAKSLWYIDKFCKSLPNEKRGEWLASQYVKATKMIEEKPELKPEVDKVHKKLDAGDKPFIELWKKTRDWSLDDFNNIYNELGVKFDVVFFESQVADAGKEIAKRLVDKGLARLDEGSLLVDLKEFGLDVFLVLKSDGTPLYSTKDLELARRKFEEFKINRSIYVVGSEQELYFKQLFKTLELMGFKDAKNCFHLSYGLVQLESGKMSSRLGNIVTYQELRDKVMEKAHEEVEKRHADWPKQKSDEVAHEIGLAALKFSMLDKERKRVIIFDINEALSFEGESGPYLQYVYTRCRSIIKKSCVNEKSLKDANLNLLKEPEEFELARRMEALPDIIEETSATYKINSLPRYLLDLAQLFNQYYQKHKVVQEDVELMQARLALVKGVAEVMSIGLGLLGIKTVEEM